MPNIPETNFKFSFGIELARVQERWIWKILNHKNKVVCQSENTFETKKECQSELSRLANSIKEFLEQ